ncbi:hypothetical protein CERZMDRAFT_98634 [Cercospora zeae-maydis SCOH1-5]|uniref:Uncharacterized protein n=1 Tax=Cercospora zeae-maydis SCOH1-5 TaxID=717836 RepID=A0A6A6FDA1_9PEZI|nr:hypothetical protein CERZMDRAFT_98634 [Cercospora zeae-maydis SCOH1-5]
MARESSYRLPLRDGGAAQSGEPATDSLQSAPVAQNASIANGYAKATGGARSSLAPHDRPYDLPQIEAQTGTAATGPSQLDARTSATRPKAKESTFPRLARPDPFAPKREITTRNFVQPLTSTKRSEEVSVPPSHGPRRNVPATPNTERLPGAAPRRQTESGAPIWDRLAQHGTLSSSAKGRGRALDHGADLQAPARELLEGQSSTPRSVLMSPRMVNVGEDFDLGMEGDREDLQGSAGASSNVDKLRQDSGGGVEGVASAAAYGNAPNTVADSELRGPQTTSSDAGSEEYEMDWRGVDWWERHVEQALNPAQVSRSSQAPGIRETAPSTRSAAPSVYRSSSRRIGASASAEDIRTIVGEAVRTAFSQQNYAAQPSWWVPSVDETTQRTRRPRADSNGLRSRTKSVIDRLLAPFKLGKPAKPSEVARRPRRMSTGAFARRTVITPDMSTPAREILGRPTLSHANSLRPEHNPALLRAGLVNGHAQRIRPQNSVPMRRTSVQPIIGSPLTTCQEEGLEEGRSPQTHTEMDAYDSQIHIGRVGPEQTGLVGIEDGLRVARAEQLRRAHDEFAAQRASTTRRAGYYGRGDRAPRLSQAPSRGSRGRGRGGVRGRPTRRGSWS